MTPPSMTDERAREIVHAAFFQGKYMDIYDRHDIKQYLLPELERRIAQALREARAQGMEEAARLLEENGRHCNAEARASIKQAAGQSTIYAEKLTREAEVCFQRAADIRQAGQGKEG